MEEAEGKARELLEELVERGGEPGPMVRAMANAPALLRGYLDLTRAMKRSHLDRRIVERINLAVHEWLSCDYCLVAHTRAARQLMVPDSEIQLARQWAAHRPEGRIARARTDASYTSPVTSPASATPLPAGAAWRHEKHCIQLRGTIASTGSVSVALPRGGAWILVRGARASGDGRAQRPARRRGR